MSENLIIRHWIATSPEEVWRAYTTPEILHQFFAPEGLSIPLDSVVIEPWVGGRFECTMVFDDTGAENPNIGVLEVVADPEVVAAFRSSFRKLGRVYGVDTEERDCN